MAMRDLLWCMGATVQAGIQRRGGSLTVSGMRRTGGRKLFSGVEDVSFVCSL